MNLAVGVAGFGGRSIKLWFLIGIPEREKEFYRMKMADESTRQAYIDGQKSKSLYQKLRNVIGDIGHTNSCFYDHSPDHSPLAQYLRLVDLQTIFLREGFNKSYEQLEAFEKARLGEASNKLNELAKRFNQAHHDLCYKIVYARPWGEKPDN